MIFANEEEEKKNLWREFLFRIMKLFTFPKLLRTSQKGKWKKKKHPKTKNNNTPQTPHLMKWGNSPASQSQVWNVEMSLSKKWTKQRQYAESWHLTPWAMNWMQTSPEGKSLQPERQWFFWLKQGGGGVTGPPGKVGMPLEGRPYDSAKREGYGNRSPRGQVNSVTKLSMPWLPIPQWLLETQWVGRRRRGGSPRSLDSHHRPVFLFCSCRDFWVLWSSCPLPENFSHQRSCLIVRCLEGVIPHPWAEVWLQIWTDNLRETSGWNILCYCTLPIPELPKGPGWDGSSAETSALLSCFRCSVQPPSLSYRFLAQVFPS